MYVLSNLYEKQNYQREVDKIETEEFYPSATVYLNYSSSKFETVDQDVTVKLIQIILWKILMVLLSSI